MDSLLAPFQTFKARATSRVLFRCAHCSGLCLCLSKGRWCCYLYSVCFGVHTKEPEQSDMTEGFFRFMYLLPNAYETFTECVL